MTLPPPQISETAVRQLFQNGTPPVLAGCAGFAAFLPELLGLSDGSVVETPQLDPRLLVLCGSVNPITLRQMDTAEQAFTRLWSTPRQKLEPSYWASATARLRWQKLNDAGCKPPLHY